MDDQQVVDRLDADDFELDAPLVTTDPDQARVEVTDCRQPPRLTGVGHGGEDVRIADAVLARGPGELDTLHTLRLLQGINVGVQRLLAAKVAA